MKTTGNNRRRNGILVLVLLGFILICCVVQYHPLLKGKLSNIAVLHVPTELLSYNKLGEMFYRLGLIQVAPNNSSRYIPDDRVLDTPDLAPFQKRRQVSETVLEVGQQHELLNRAEQVLKRRKHRKGGAAISLFSQQKNLDGEKGIITYYHAHGRKWERLAFVAMENGETPFHKSGVGLRLHGGASRDPSLPHHSFRLYFRKVYGAQWLDSSAIFKENSELRTLVVHVDLPEGWPLNNVIASRVYAMVGVPTLEYSQAEFFLNGERQGLYWLSPHLSEEYIRERYALSSIHYQRYRGQLRNEVYMADLGRLMSKENGPLRFEKLDSVVDADDLVNYFIAVTYSGNTDWNQGVGFKNALDSKDRWRWVAWDLDHSFIDWYVAKSRHPDRDVWQQDGLPLLMGKKLQQIKSRRQLLLRRLFVEDPGFKRYFINRYVNVLNHELRVEKLLELHQEYQQILTNYDMELNPELIQFFRKRHPHMRWELNAYFSVPEFQMLTIEADVPSSLIIDGYSEELPYTGYYPKGFFARIESPKQPEDATRQFYRDGAPMGRETMSIQLQGATRIEWRQ